MNKIRDTAELVEFGETERLYGGEGGIRTLEGFNPLHTFQACSFSHSDTSPILNFCYNSFLTQTFRLGGVTFHLATEHLSKTSGAL